MNKIIHKSIVCSIMLIAVLLPATSRADGRRGHHPDSGIVGQAYDIGFGDGLNGSPPDATPIQTHITIYSLPPVRKHDPFGLSALAGKYVMDIETDEDGNFAAYLRPGRYLIVPDQIVPNSPFLSLIPTSQVAVVEKETYTTVNVYYGPWFHDF